MQSPYTPYPVDAFMVAEGSVALALSSVLLFRASRSWPSRLLLVTAVVLAVIAPALPDLAKGLGFETTHDHYLRLLALSAAVATLGMLFTRPWLVLIALVGEYWLSRASHFFTEQDLELSALHVAWIGALIGFEKLAQAPPTDPAPRPSETSFWSQDLLLAAVSTALAALVATFVLRRQCFSADEWAYTFQASVFAKLHAYSVRPDCYEAFRAFWVFEKDGRLFSQYTPGWPFFMAPFMRIGAPWLAGAFSLGLMIVPIVRLARRAAAATIDANALAASRHVRLAGILAGVATVLSDTVLINGGSRFSHIFVCGLFAWSIEAICMLTSPLAPSRQTRWGVVLGVALGLLIATRPPDAAVLGFGLFLYFVYALVRRRVSWRSLVATAIPFLLVNGLTLVVLRLQLGAWFTTGYSLTAIIHPWSKIAFSVPKPNEWRWGIPLGTGSYCWWPLAPSIGFAGLLALGRTRERRIAFMTGLGCLSSLAFYTANEFGRGWDFGYGPRYQLVMIVPMAIATGVVFAPLFNAALSRLAPTTTLFEGGPAALAIGAAILGVIRIAPLVYPYNWEDVRNRNLVFDAIKKDHLSNAIVWVERGTTMSDPLDLPQNLPLDLYGASVYVLRDTTPELRQCVREGYPGHRWYHTEGRGEVRLVPE